MLPETYNVKNPLTVSFRRPESNEQLAEPVRDEVVVLAMEHDGVAPETYWMD